MSAMTEVQAAKWRETRKKGKGRYVFLSGVLLWGIALTVLFTAIQWLTQQTFTKEWLYIRLFVFGCIGFFIANFRWDAKEIKFLDFDNKGKDKSRRAAR
ncbi:hypothetical protein ACFQI7_22350 [Paenibacillus allorhizosphaerae]|uniref:Uncharacterized protein n=1 Tax=Paenibacillus allorhizosphaerae TaxID=2849866 RepID=A0ABN7TVH8_9BACL|nr:hypothetical protein [Paenibacillus allorhizosphaerae]CAG7657314.1 hypothetical protein PAECIP111802_06690 [Paenibacillus allorhizosphaerae]